MNNDSIERAAQFNARMEQVAEQLSKLDGVLWSYEPGDENFARPYGNLARGEDGLPSRRFRLHVQSFRDGYSASARERVKVSTSWPRASDGSYKGLREYGIISYSQSEPSITVSAEASAERMAKDIIRRMIVAESLYERYQQVLDRQAKDAAYADRKAGLAAELFALAEQRVPEGAYQPSRDPEVRLYDFAPGVSYGNMRVSSDDSVRIEISVNGEIAKQFLAMLKARRGQVAA